MSANTEFPDNLYDYIRLYENAIPAELCDTIINQYSKTDLWKQQGANGDNDSLHRRVNGIYISGPDVKTTNDRKKIDEDIFQAMNTIVNKYIMTFPLLNNYPLFHIQSDSGYTLLKYDEGDFYKIHTDQDLDKDKPRIISCVACLNGDYNGGEFSFLNKKKTFKLKKGSVLMFPSNFMFSHEVLPITSGTRYSIVTWFH